MKKRTDSFYKMRFFAICSEFHTFYRVLESFFRKNSLLVEKMLILHRICFVIFGEHDILKNNFVKIKIIR